MIWTKEDEMFHEEQERNDPELREERDRKAEERERHEIEEAEGRRDER